MSPSVILGVGLIGSGVSLWQIRQSKPWISKDYDVVVSCISLLVGGILIFQGWRLDPLLLFGQLMTTGAALSFAVEALRLRSELYKQEEREALSGGYRRNAESSGRYEDDNGNGGNGGNGRWSGGGPQQLPPPEGAYYPGQEFEYYDVYDGNDGYDDSTYYDRGEENVRVYETTIGEEEDGQVDAGDGFGFGSIGYARPYRDLPGDEDDF